MAALKKCAGRLSYSVIRMAPWWLINRAFLRLFSMIWPAPTKTKVRFPSPAPLFSSANSQFFRALSYECPTKRTGSAPFSEAFTAGIETVVQGPVSFSRNESSTGCPARRAAAMT